MAVMLEVFILMLYCFGVGIVCALDSNSLEVVVGNKDRLAIE